VNKNELLARLEARLGSRRAAAAALDSVLTEIQGAVADGERVTLTGFGTFERVQRSARTGRNPRTGAAIEIAASAAPRFHPGSGLRAAVAGTSPGRRAVAATAPSGLATGNVTASPATTGARPPTASTKPKDAKKPKHAKKPKDAKKAKDAKTKKKKD
jgi:DNA-binding protein HU-beta